jgi:hypothetical protein
MKTAIQELIDYVDAIWSNGGWEETIKEKAKELLEKEKEQITKAYNSAIPFKFGEEYYNQTYNKNK